MSSNPLTSTVAPTEEPTPSTARRDTVLPLAAAGVTILLWASAFVGIRAVADDLSPGPLALGRLVVGSLVLGLVVAARRERWPSRRDMVPIVLCGVLWFGVYNVALNAGEQRVDAGTAALVVNIGPILIAVLAWAFLGEGLPGRLLAGSVLGFAGVALIAAASSGTGGAHLSGVALCGLAALTYAAAVVLQKGVLGRVSALQVTFLACTTGAVVTLPFTPTLATELVEGPRSALAWVVYLGVFPTALAFTTWAYALARTTAGKQGATTYLVPAVAILMAWLLLAEAPPALAFVGGAVSLAGVAVTRSRRRGARLPVR